MNKFCPECGTRLDGASECPICMNARTAPAAARRPAKRNGTRLLAGGAILAGVAALVLGVTVPDAVRRAKVRAERASVEAFETAPDARLAEMAATDPVALAELATRKFDAIFAGKSGAIGEEDLERIQTQMDEAGRMLLQAWNAVAAEGRPGSPRALRVRGQLWAWRDFVGQYPETSAAYNRDAAFRRQIDGIFGGTL